MTLTIQHLDKSLTYNLTLYGSYGVSANDYLTEVTINDDASGKQSYNAGGAAGEGSVTFTNVAPDINGKIKIVLRATHATNRGYNNVLDIQAVPEPGTSALLGLAGLAALRRRITH
ncbi:MAG: PEP-CTERM sorting domain-containing protein [Planctomycetes bacterium]|nr:PEP-CTERM sorting domain-containing protein [Planctomycetota bacterium]